MATFDLFAACNEMARLLAAVTPPFGDTMRKAYGQQPNNTPMLPGAIVVPEHGELILEPGVYQGKHKVDVWFLIEKASIDFPRIETRRQKWLPILYHAFDGEMALGLAPVVKKVFPIGWDFSEILYGGVSYDGIILHYEVDTAETVTLAP